MIAFLSLLLAGGGVIVHNSFIQAVQSYTWTQSSWSSGASSSQTANHTSNQTNWTYYNTADSNVTLNGSSDALMLQNTTTFSDSLSTWAYRDRPNTTAYWDIDNGQITLEPIGFSASYISAWQNPFLTTADIEEVFFIDDTTGWAVGEDGLILKTTDGGTSWTMQASGVATDINDVHFLDSNTGWAVGNSAVILKTTNGGSSWTSQTPPSGACSNYEGVYFADSSTGYVVGSTCSSQNTAKTTNGGSLWVGSSAGSIEINDVFCRSTSACWIVGNSGRVRKTTNGGSTWPTQTSGTTANLYAVDFINDDVGWFAGASGTARTTSNGGSSWTNQSPGFAADIYDLDMVDASNGFLVTTGNEVYRTTSGGSSWSSVASGLSDALRGVSARSSTLAYAAGVDGEYAETANGTTWTEGTSGAVDEFRFVDAVDTSNAWAVGDGGVIFATTNGSTWSAQTSGTANDLRHVSFHKESDGDLIGWVTGGSGTALKTTNNGSTWSSVDVGSSVQLNDVYFLDDNNGWIVGTSGANRKTTDGGSNWSSAGLSAAASTLTSVYFVNSTTGWIVSGGGSIWKTTDGSNWSTQTCSGFSGSMFDVYFADANTGWIAGSGGQVCRTSNGGTTWTLSTSGSSSLNSIYAFGTSTLWIAGDSGALYYSTNGGSSFTSVTVSTGNDFNAIDFSGPSTAWLVGHDDDDTTIGSIEKFSTTPTYTGASSKVARSLTIDSTPATINFATLTATSTIPTGSSITYELSADGGSNWESVTSGSAHTFTNTGSDLRWRATLTGGASVTDSPTLSNVQVVYSSAYPSSQTLTSSWFDTGSDYAYPTSFSWSETQPTNTELKFQIRTAPDTGSSAPDTGNATTFCGPNNSVSGTCSTTTYFTDKTGGDALDDVHQAGSNDRWVQYRATFESSDNLNTPILTQSVLGYNRYDVPSAPTLTVNGGTTTDTPKNPTITLTYSGDLTLTQTDWELYSNAALTSLVDSFTGDTSGTSTTPTEMGTTLSGHTSYWIRARTANAIGYGDWSAATKFTTINTTPVISSSLGDVTMSEDTSDTSINLSVLITDADNDTLTFSATGQSANFTVSIAASGIVTLTPASNYYGSESVTFTANDGYGGTPSDTITVTINNVNDAPAAPSAGFSPSGGETSSSLTPTLSWTAATDIDDSSANLYYTIRYGTDSSVDPKDDSNATQVTTSTGQTTHTIAAQLTDETTYYYQIRSTDDDGALSGWSTVQQFYVNSSLDPIISALKTVGINQSSATLTSMWYVPAVKERFSLLPEAVFAQFFPALQAQNAKTLVTVQSSFLGSLFLESYKLLSQPSLSYLLLGVVLASLVFGITLVRHPGHLFTLLLRHPMNAFPRVAPRQENGTYQYAYSDFKRRAALSRGTFLISLLLLVLKILFVAYLSAFFIHQSYIAVGFNDDGVEVESGDILTYRIDYNNTGDGSATSFVLSDVVPDGTEYRANSLIINDETQTDAANDDQAAYNDSGDAITFSVGSIAASGESGATGYVQFSVRVADSVADDDTISNSASYTYSEQTTTENTNATVNPVTVSATDSANATIGYIVYDDADRDIKLDTGEKGIQGVKLQLYSDANSNGTLERSGTSKDTLLQQITSDSAGRYEFSALGVGTYFVYVDETSLASGYTLTTDNNPKKVEISSNSQDYQGANFGYALPTSSIGDAVFSDANQNGIFDVGESGLQDVTVKLYQDVNNSNALETDEDVLKQTATTDRDGQYLFSQVGTGVYFVTLDTSTITIASYRITTEDAVIRVAITTDTDQIYRLADFGFYALVAVINPSDSPATGSEDTREDTTETDSGDGSEDDEDSSPEDDSSETTPVPSSEFVFVPPDVAAQQQEVPPPALSLVDTYSAEDGGAVNIYKPTFEIHGTTKPCALVILYIRSEPVIKIAKADINGNWTMALNTKELSGGEHTILAQADVAGERSDLAQIATINVYENEKSGQLAVVIIVNLIIIFVILLITSLIVVARR